MVRDCLILITSTFSYVVVVPKRHCLFLSIIIININKNFVESNNLLSLWYIKTNTMKLKQLFLAVTITLFAISCTKQDTFTPQPNVVKIEETIKTSSVGTTSESNLKAYIFVEPQSKLGLIVNYLKSVPRSTQTVFSTPFYGFFTGLPIKSTNYTDLINYINIPHWYNGTLPAVIQSEIPQISGGPDTHGNTKTAYNFTTIKINKGTLNEYGWVTVLIPVNAMSNDTKKQVKIAYYAKNGTKIVSSGNNTQTIINTNSTLYSFVLNYTGTRIPAGQYRVYSTYGGTEMRVKFNTTNDVYFRGASN